MVNSIKACLDKDSTISEIKLSLGAWKDIVCVVVEGDSDQRVFASLFASQVKLFQSYSGKMGVEEIVNYFSSNNRVIGIRDRDYLEKSPLPKLFLTDYCCLEIMIVSVHSCFERLYANYYRGNEKSEIVIRKCLSHLERYSKLRKLNEQNRLNLRLNDVGINKAYDEDFDKMDKRLFDEVKRQNHNIDSSKYMFLLYDERCLSYEDLLYIVNGHDFVNIFSHICQKYNKKAGNNLIEASIFSSFGEAEFEETQLFSAILEYQNKNGVVILEKSV